MTDIQLLTRAPQPSADFTPLAQHQARTPGRFFGAKPVLHLACRGATLLAAAERAGAHEALARLFGVEGAGAGGGEGAGADAGAVVVGNGVGGVVNGGGGGGRAGGEGRAGMRVVEGVDAFVTSEHLILFSPAAAAGLSIPYPAISLHAIQRLPDPATTTSPSSSPSPPLRALYMQLLLATNPDDDDDDDDDDGDLPSIDLTLIPGRTTATDTAADSVAAATPNEAAARSLFAAVSASIEAKKLSGISSGTSGRLCGLGPQRAMGPLGSPVPRKTC
ncbi:regulator of volume decrease after cellular swelling-domain-containing protein [Lineolata rhizophorae]|uniref:Regulator of volume decrease after cellular swelling-domain-containing protein n=1 Tax=Lineolata rhizophorae TaxID=578093 RepID=A0A6A6NVC1_9PEZI|nr:regulator of volume decrease after cellular swelling-domain-containing protein [Lineolata rhizophorae]